MKTLANHADCSELLARIRALAPHAERRWGAMSVGQMVCHLNDSFGTGLGERAPSPSRATWLTRTVHRWVGLHTALPWPKNAPTGNAVTQGEGGGGTPPGAFDNDRASLEQQVVRFAESGPERRPAHPTLGPLTEAEWMRWGWVHPDHHLRQFGA